MNVDGRGPISMLGMIWVGWICTNTQHHHMWNCSSSKPWIGQLLSRMPINFNYFQLGNTTQLLETRGLLFWQYSIQTSVIISTTQLLHCIVYKNFTIGSLDKPFLWTYWSDCTQPAILIGSDTYYIRVPALDNTTQHPSTCNAHSSYTLHNICRYIKVWGSAHCMCWCYPRLELGYRHIANLHCLQSNPTYIICLHP